MACARTLAPSPSTEFSFQLSLTSCGRPEVLVRAHAVEFAIHEVHHVQVLESEQHLQRRTLRK
jgi:hypothetical protein